VKWNSQNPNTPLSALPIQNAGQVCPSNANHTNIKGVVGKSVDVNFGISTTGPSAHPNFFFVVEYTAKDFFARYGPENPWDDFKLEFLGSPSYRAVRCKY
jgi:hypothetical protein